MLHLLIQTISAAIAHSRFFPAVWRSGPLLSQLCPYWRRELACLSASAALQFRLYCHLRRHGHCDPHVTMVCGTEAVPGHHLSDFRHHRWCRVQESTGQPTTRSQISFTWRSRPVLMPSKWPLPLYLGLCSFLKFRRRYFRSAIIRLTKNTNFYRYRRNHYAVTSEWTGHRPEIRTGPRLWIWSQATERSWSLEMI